MKTIISFVQNYFNLWKLKHFVRKKAIIIRTRVESGTILQTEKKSSVIKKMLFTGTNETNTLFFIRTSKTDF